MAKSTKSTSKKPKSKSDTTSDLAAPKASPATRRAKNSTKTSTKASRRARRATKSKSKSKPVVSSPNPHHQKPAQYSYPNHGPVTVTYRNPRQRQDRKQTYWVHVDKVIHWLERGLWHHLSPIDPKADIVAIQVGSRFMA